MWFSVWVRSFADGTEPQPGPRRPRGANKLTIERINILDDGFGEYVTEHLPEGYVPTQEDLRWLAAQYE